MEPNLKNLFDTAKQVSLSEGERTALRARFASAPERARSPYTFAHSRLLFQGVAAFLIIVGAGGSTALAASNALPGDVLFPIKVNVNEKVEEILAQTPEAKAAVAAVQADRRLEEAEELVRRGRLTDEVTKEVEERFAKKSEIVKERVKALRESKKDDHADEVEKRFNERIESRFQSFTELEDGEGSTTPGVRKVRDTLERERKSRGHGRGGDDQEEIRGVDDSPNSPDDSDSRSGDSRGSDDEDDSPDSDD